LSSRSQAPWQLLLASNELTDARFKGLIGYLANLEAEASENATEAEFDVREFMLQLLAPNQQRTHLLRSM